MIRCYVTDRRSGDVIASARRAIADGVDYIQVREKDLSARDQLSLVSQIREVVDFSNRKIFYSWIGGTRAEWRGQGRYRALTEQQEEWAHAHGYHELVVKTKNKFYPMRATLDHLNFDIIKFQRHLRDNRESKLYLSKKIAADVLNQHRTTRSVVEAA